MAKLVFPHRKLGQPKINQSMVKVSGRARWWGFVRVAMRLGSRQIVVALGTLGTLVGVSAMAGLTIVVELPAAWAVSAAAVLLGVMFGTGAYQAWSDAAIAVYRFMPTWEQLQDRADLLETLLDTREPGDWDEFVAQSWIGGHRDAARADFDMAATAGFPLRGVDRNDLRKPSRETYESLIRGFREAAATWRADERG